MKEWIGILWQPFVRLVEVLAGDEYDEEAELAALLELNRAVKDAQARRKFPDA
jgi:hypothetical protein